MSFWRILWCSTVLLESLILSSHKNFNPTQLFMAKQHALAYIYVSCSPLNGYPTWFFDCLFVLETKQEACPYNSRIGFYALLAFVQVSLNSTWWYSIYTFDSSTAAHYSSGSWAPFLAALAPGINIIRMLLLGLGLLKDDATVKSMSRHGDYRWLLRRHCLWLKIVDNSSCLEFVHFLLSISLLPFRSPQKFQFVSGNFWKDHCSTHAQ